MGKQTFRFGPTTIEYLIETREDGKNTFCAEDVLGALPECHSVCEITDIYTEFSCRKQGYAKAAVIKFISRVAPTMPVIVTAFASVNDYPIEPTKDEIESDVEWKSEFLEKLGFTDINSYVGYEYKKAYLYVNGLTQKVIDDYVNKPTA